MLGLGLRRQPRGVGRHKGEGWFRIVTVFCQVEMHATDQIPGGVEPPQEGLKIVFPTGPGKPRTPRPSRPTARAGRPRSGTPPPASSGRSAPGWRFLRRSAAAPRAGPETTEPPRPRPGRAGTAPPRIAPRSRATRRRRGTRPGRPRPPPAAEGRARCPGRRRRRAAPRSCRPGRERPRPPRAGCAVVASTWSQARHGYRTILRLIRLPRPAFGDGAVSLPEIPPRIPWRPPSVGHTSVKNAEPVWLLHRELSRPGITWFGGSRRRVPITTSDAVIGRGTSLTRSVVPATSTPPAPNRTPGRRVRSGASIILTG